MPLLYLTWLYLSVVMVFFLAVLVYMYVFAGYGTYRLWHFAHARGWPTWIAVLLCAIALPALLLMVVWPYSVVVIGAWLVHGRRGNLLPQAAT